MLNYFISQFPKYFRMIDHGRCYNQVGCTVIKVAVTSRTDGIETDGNNIMLKCQIVMQTNAQICRVGTINRSKQRIFRSQQHS